MKDSSAIAGPMQERFAPSRPLCLGTRRRKPRQAVSAVPATGASRSAPQRGAASLDTEKQLATSVRDWLLSQQTDWDIYQNRRRLHSILLTTVYRIWQDYAAAPKDEAEATWWESYEEQKAKLAADENLEYDAWLEARVKKHGIPSCPEAYLRGMYLQEWKRKNKPTGRCREILKWEKQYFQLYHCQGEWIGYRAECCKERTQPIAVPIGCNHRLCPLCAWHRSEKARRRTKKLFDRLTHPVFITLTVPNKASIRKRDFEFFRKQIRKFIAQNKGWIEGGVYSLETTYNRTEHTWHIHAHVLADVSCPLPSTREKAELAGETVYRFTVLKRRLEFDWLRLWTRAWGKKQTAKATAVQVSDSEWEFKRWILDSRAHVTHKREGRGSVRLAGLSDAEFLRRTEWNARNRRVISIKPVDNRDKAAREVLKYVTKAADFCDLPEAVEGFYNAAKGARLIQTFGTWYGVTLDGPCDHEDPEDWGHLKCACGVNFWQRIGLYYRRDVVMNAGGRWLLKQPHDWNSSGTVARPTIRALDGREEAFSYGNNRNLDQWTVR